ncbi:aminotransferase class I/II-fold pyridoxal phosphate-dependent enzyme [Virgisporangium ochraceum]
MKIYLSPPDIGELEQAYVAEALRSGWVAPAGPDLDAFERELADRAGVPYAVALSSGTAALLLALLALGAGAGTAVIVPTLTFAATANAAVYTGAEPVFVDCDPATGNLDPDLLGRALKDHDVSAVVPVDLFGRCADYDAILPVCDRYGVPVLEDAAEALGATYGDRPAGSFGSAAVFSFNGNKIMTTSGGGALLSESRNLVDRCRYLSTQARQPVVHYEHTDIGYNYRLSNVLAALGRAQLKRLDEMIGRRRAVRERYAKLFDGVKGVTLLGADDLGSNCWLTTVVVDPAEAGWTAADLAGVLRNHDIETRPIWKPMHLQPVFAKARSYVTGAAQRLFETGLALPSGSSLGPGEVDRVLTAVHNFLDAR